MRKKNLRFNQGRVMMRQGKFRAKSSEHLSKKEETKIMNVPMTRVITAFKLLKGCYDNNLQR